MKMHGGKVIGSGTYGCVFKPPLICEDDTERPKNYISKVMSRRNAEEEDREIKRILDLVNHIPNYEDYYMVSGVKLCKPKQPESQDLRDYRDKCYALLRKKINIHKFRHEIDNGNILMLQIPDGGASIDDLFRETLTMNEFTDINNAMVNLLKHGIVPLNESNILHMDVKGGNIVYSQKEKKAKLIDWGLAINYRNPNETPNDELEQYSIMVNQPFTRLLFYRDFVYELIAFNYERKIQDIPNKTYKTLMPIYIKHLRENYFKDSKDERDIIFSIKFDGPGHLDYILSIFSEISKLIGRSVNGLDIIAQQIAGAYLTFSLKDGELHNFDENAFFSSVFRHNCDVFGFLYCYYDILTNTSFHKSMRTKLALALMRFIYSTKYSHKKYNIDKITSVLKEFNTGKKVRIVSPRKSPPKTQKTVKRKFTPFKITLEEAESDKAVKELLTLGKVRRRCPNGTRRDKKTGECKKIRVLEPSPKPNVFSLSPTRKRCPKGYRMNKKTRKCHRKTL
jgi:hypothetical protein